VLAEHYVGLGKALEQSVVDHGLGACRRLFRWLKDRHQRALPVFTRRRKQGGSANQPRHMHVVTASVHDVHGFSGPVGHGHLAGIGQTRGFLHWECVHVGPQHDHGTVAITQQTDNAGLSDAGGHFVSGGTKMVRRDPSRPGFLH
jgi:hypothetical protein